jgi:hypothetical protein
MGADWGLYSALRGQDNWAQKRQDKMQNLMILERREQRAQQDLEKQMQLEQGMQKYFDEISKLDALAEDQGRIEEKEKEARRNIYKGIAAVNGNLKAYMSTGGISALSDYKRDILNSDAVKNAALNKVNMSNFIKDKSEGKYIRDVEIEVPVMEADGVTPKIKDGKPVTEKRTVTMEEQAKLFKDGVITKLNYNGAERKVKLDPLKFSKTVKNPNDPYTAYAVTTDDMYNYALEMGASEEYAKKIAIEYGKSAVKTKQPWRWAKRNEYEDMEKAAKAAKYRSSASGGGKGGTMTLNQLGLSLMRDADQARQTGKNVPRPMGMYDMSFFHKAFNLNEISSEGRIVPTRALKAIDEFTGRETDIMNALNLQFTQEYVTTPEGRKYIKAKVTYDADEPQEGNPHTENMFGVNSLVQDEARNNWVFKNLDETNMAYDNMELDNGHDVVEGYVLIDITKQANNQQYMDQFNRYAGITNKFQGASASADESMQEQSFMNNYEAIVNQIIKNENVSREEAERIANTLYRN